MQVIPDDQVYHVDAVWLGPERLSFPWRARYSAYALGLLIFIVAFGVERQIGVGLSFFSVAWTLIITVLITRWVGSRITHNQPMGHHLNTLRAEITTPRRRTDRLHVAVRTDHVRQVRTRPRPEPDSPAARRGARRYSARHPQSRAPLSGAIT